MIFAGGSELGRAREQAEQRRVSGIGVSPPVELAPTYSLPHWQLGNFYLRQNRSERSLCRTKKSRSKQCCVYRAQVYSIAWDILIRQSPARSDCRRSIRCDKPVWQSFTRKELARRQLCEFGTASDRRKNGPERIVAKLSRRFFTTNKIRSAVEFVRQT